MDDEIEKNTYLLGTKIGFSSKRKKKVDGQKSENNV